MSNFNSNSNGTENRTNIINFYGRARSRVFCIYVDTTKTYQIIDVTGKSTSDIIKMLPKPTPNFYLQGGTDKNDVLQNVKDQQFDILF